MHAHLDRTSLESILFSETNAVVLFHTCLWSRIVEFVDLRRRSGIPIIAEPRDAELLEDLKDLFNTPSVDGNDAKYQDFRFRIHMSFVSAVSDTVRNRGKSNFPGSRENARRCTLEVLRAVALISRGSVRTLCPIS